MANYISFRDVGAVMAAGAKLAAEGQKLNTGVTSFEGTLGAREAVFTRRDGYSQGFWNDTYAAWVSGSVKCAPRNQDLISQGKAWAGRAQAVGEDVVKATTALIWQDAVNAAELASARLA